MIYRQATRPSGLQLARLCAEILNNNANAADLFGDARKLALALHDESHELAPLARDVALNIIQWTAREHQAAELAAQAAEIAGEEISQWQ